MGYSKVLRKELRCGRAGPYNRKTKDVAAKVKLAIKNKTAGSLGGKAGRRDLSRNKKERERANIKNKLIVIGKGRDRGGGEVR